jgi:hypothetical protein
MTEKRTGRLLLEEKDFVDVYDDDGAKLPYQVPKHWGVEQLAAGVTTAKPRGSRGRSAGGSGSGGSAGEEPAADNPA